MARKQGSAQASKEKRSSSHMQDSVAGATVSYFFLLFDVLCLRLGVKKGTVENIVQSGLLMLPKFLCYDKLVE